MTTVKFHRILFCYILVYTMHFAKKKNKHIIISFNTIIYFEILSNSTRIFVHLYNAINIISGIIAYYNHNTFLIYITVNVNFEIKLQYVTCILCHKIIREIKTSITYFFYNKKLTNICHGLIIMRETIPVHHILTIFAVNQNFIGTHYHGISFLQTKSITCQL